MAVSLSTTSSFFINTSRLNLKNDGFPARVFPKPPPSRRNCRFSLQFESRDKTIRVSPRRSCVAVSAISGSPEVSVVSEHTADLLERVQVFDLNGNGIPVSDLWKDRKAVVAFARHFGCVLCWKRADYLASTTTVNRLRFMGWDYFSGRSGGWIGLLV